MAVVCQRQLKGKKTKKDLNLNEGLGTVAPLAFVFAVGEWAERVAEVVQGVRIERRSRCCGLNTCIDFSQASCICTAKAS